jgi:hypothetical protein
MAKPGEITHTYLQEATKHDDAKIPIWLWNDQLKTQAWDFLEGRWDAALVVIPGFGLRFWRRKVKRSLFEWFHQRYLG